MLEVAPRHVTDQEVSWPCIAELDEAIDALPGALASEVPELMIDYIATVFRDEDCAPVARCAV